MNESVIKAKLQTLLSDGTPLRIEEFVGKTEELFVEFPEIQINVEKVKCLIEEGWLTAKDDLIKTDEFLKLNPLSLINVECFAKETELSLEETQELIENGVIQAIDLGCTMISRNELRRYWRENDMRVIHSQEDLFTMLDSLFRDNASWWNQFYSDRNRGIPFFLDVPDENLVSYIQERRIKPKKVLELGCGNGRNAIYLAQSGCEVDAVDFSAEAIRWAREMGRKKQVQVNWICDSLFNLSLEKNAYDLIYDSGCFHHILPHRRFSYIEVIERALKPGGYLGMTCFKQDAGGLAGPEFSDWEIYEKRTTGGGIAFSRHQLERIFTDVLEIVDFRQMHDIQQPSDMYGVWYLWAVLFQRCAS